VDMLLLHNLSGDQNKHSCSAQRHALTELSCSCCTPCATCTGSWSLSNAWSKAKESVNKLVSKDDSAPTPEGKASRTLLAGAHSTLTG
jgi:hypothetical protein